MPVNGCLVVHFIVNPNYCGVTFGEMQSRHGNLAIDRDSHLFLACEIDHRISDVEIILDSFLAKSLKNKCE